MVYCGTHTLVKSGAEDRTIIPLPCRSWSCEDCGPKRQRQIAETIKAGNPDTIITLTVNPEVGEDPGDRLRLLADAWRRVRRKARKVWANGTLPFFCVVERTKRGEPHLHIVARCQWIGQKWLSAQMADLIGAPVVGIERIKSQRRVARYVSKYLAKAPERFGTAKRYWSSQDWVQDLSLLRARQERSSGRWEVIRRAWSEVVQEHVSSAWVVVGLSPLRLRHPWLPP